MCVKLSALLAMVFCESQPPTETVKFDTVATMNSKVDNFYGGLTLAKSNRQAVELSLVIKRQDPTRPPTRSDHTYFPLRSDELQLLPLQVHRWFLADW